MRLPVQVKQLKNQVKTFAGADRPLPDTTVEWRLI
jgi:hypothetical protein